MPLVWDETQLARDLEELRYHWSGAYMITTSGSQFIAQRRDTYATLKAASAEELFSRIHADYAARPVPRRKKR